MKKFSRLLVMLLLSIALAVFLTNCGSGGGGGDEGVSDTSNPSDSSDTSNSITPLTEFEEELVGKWSRYHSYSDEYQYYIFKADRTACYFEHDGSRKNYKAYSHWELQDTSSITRFEIVVITSSGTLFNTKDEYRYDIDKIYKGGYSSLVMGSSSTSRDCD